MPSSLDFNTQFSRALDLLENSNKHLFITGKAGTGKSTLLNHFRKTTKRKHVVLASTGVAAVNIEGETVHSFFGFHPGITPIEARREGQNRKETSVFRNVEMIIIDEVSMIRSDLLDSIDAFLQGARHNSSPFGGVQMVFIGDLYQLPPVLTSEEKDAFLSIYNSPYFFDSVVVQGILNDMFENRFELIELEQIYRQNDSDFIELLNRVRNKLADFTLIKKLNERYQPHFVAKEEYIYLVTTNRQADEINQKKLSELKSSPIKFKATVTGAFDPKSFPTDEELTLKTGTRVMFVKNDPGGRWINGTLGTVSGFVSSGFSTNVKVQIDNGPQVEVEPASWDSYKTLFDKGSRSIEREIVGSFTQIPLKLAWAFTIHKSQGKTFDRVILDIGNGAFAHGQIYVALSRCKTFEGLVLKRPIRSFDIKMDRVVEEFMEKLKTLKLTSS